MSKTKEIKRKTLLEKAAADRQEYTLREKALVGAIGKMRAAMLMFAEGENWALKDRRFLGWPPGKARSDYIWVGEGNPQKLADTVMTGVFGKDYLRAEEEHRDGK